MEFKMLTERDIWTLKSWMASEQNNDRFQEFCSGVRGQLIYTIDGQMSVILVHPEWERTGFSPDRGFREGAIAYGGFYKVKSDSIEHHVQHTNIRAWIGQTLMRQACLQDSTLILTTPITRDTQGESAIHQLTWMRLVSNS
jgi:hypothetical protein